MCISITMYLYILASSTLGWLAGLTGLLAVLLAVLLCRWLCFPMLLTFEKGGGRGRVSMGRALRKSGEAEGYNKKDREVLA